MQHTRVSRSSTCSVSLVARGLLKRETVLHSCSLWHTLTIRDVELSAGAGFVVAYAGTLLTMPGLPKRPAAMDIDIDDNGVMTGIF
jgi:formyltetrahydrofolate synthetase